jgi:hypothetical protein
MKKLLILPLLLACHSGGEKSAEAAAINRLCPPVTFIGGCDGSCGYKVVVDAHASVYDCKGQVVQIHGALASTLIKNYRPQQVIVP